MMFLGIPGRHFITVFSTLSWNVNSIAKDDFQRVRLIEAHNSISICETKLNYLIFYLMTILLCIPKIQETLGMVELVCSTKIQK